MKCFAPGLATFDDQLALTVQQAVTRSFLTARAALGASALKSLQLLMCIRKTPLYFTPLPSRRSFAFPPFLFLFLFFVDLFSLVAFLLIAIVILPFVYLLVRAWLRFFLSSLRLFLFACSSPRSRPLQRPFLDVPPNCSRPRTLQRQTFSFGNILRPLIPGRFQKDSRTIPAASRPLFGEGRPGVAAPLRGFQLGASRLRGAGQRNHKFGRVSMDSRVVSLLEESAASLPRLLLYLFFFFSICFFFFFICFFFLFFGF